MLDLFMRFGRRGFDSMQLDLRDYEKTELLKLCSEKGLPPTTVIRQAIGFYIQFNEWQKSDPEGASQIESEFEKRLSSAQCIQPQYKSSANG